ncbi:MULTISPECIES: class I SAM-dependent methyltransferase [unclassified Streptomyces]|uniref:class I SAM-dependent methyltransferase n=1 Tax=unclassified Streptomyces TaxID=2593676 RepID=UPI00088FDF87|nr:MULTISPECIES: class I SAM-dependent methyltransferase [unclassified Streptomyces]PBC85569.1 putative O-methyltransferase YrrM [Streptomyces sp. 2321.6]SDR11715.1 Predicted O-methyltransferase YrrM [Streptomyces sp. KS_16]SED72205.1 Predicted O-methyltransferase YrrM [Streptomyces sp. 2133.1]SEE08874.1 Predicted O-methyltransferase YrrM [Streptomyces sp. 2112.3]SNC72145.1 Predicted O-methyltransferase YrrM [Streptomyces sp. 2114.4]
MEAITVEHVSGLYAKYQDDLRVVRDAQRKFLRDRGKSMKAQLDDYEAEITYLLLRDVRPEVVVEVGTFYGWSTMWILSALRDNGIGHLHSFDIVDNVVRNVPAELSADRWTFTKGDIQQHPEKIPAETDYLFIDADHGSRFAHWYIENLFPAVPPRTPTSVHDVFHGRRPKPFSEGSVIVKWLAEQNIEFFTPSTAKAPQVTRQLAAVKKELGLDEPVRDSDHNPMIFFTLP